MAARRTWYKDAKYDHPADPVYLTGDKSTIEVLAPAEDRRIIRRTYDDGYVQEIHFELMAGGWRKYLREDPGPAHPQRHLSPQQRTQEFEKALVNGEINITARGPVPGLGLGRTRDSGTGLRFGSSADFEEHYAKNGLAKMGRSDHSTRHVASDADLDRLDDKAMDEFFAREYQQMRLEDAREKAMRQGGGSIPSGAPPTAGLPEVKGFAVKNESSLPPLE